MDLFDFAYYWIYTTFHNIWAFPAYYHTIHTGGGLYLTPIRGYWGLFILHPVQVHVTEELSSPLFLAVLDGLDDGPEDGAGRGNRVVFQSVDIARRDEEAITFLQ